MSIPKIDWTPIGIWGPKERDVLIGLLRLQNAYASPQYLSGERVPLPGTKSLLETKRKFRKVVRKSIPHAYLDEGEKMRFFYLFRGVAKLYSDMEREQWRKTPDGNGLVSDKGEIRWHYVTRKSYSFRERPKERFWVIKVRIGYDRSDIELPAGEKLQIPWDKVWLARLYGLMGLERRRMFRSGGLSATEIVRRATCPWV